jgi:hypothetical protein
MPTKAHTIRQYYYTLVLGDWKDTTMIGVKSDHIYSMDT